ncbi:LysR family transcriptional regulator [Labrenzia sp. 011]|nr:LysR family transcriptional regulator [Labrenzia sp. 011]
MASRLPPLPALQAFEAAARHENFAAAAVELNLSQSAVSHRVRSLEQHLGFLLFERLPRGLRLTEAAKAYLPSVRQAFDDILSATSGVFGRSGRTTLNIRAPISYATLWLAPLVDRFVKEFPHVEVSISSSIWVERLATGGTDVEIRIGRGHWTGYEAELLFKDALVPVCSVSAAESMGASAEPADLADRPLVHLMGIEDYWARYFEQFGIDRKRRPVDIGVDSAMTSAELAASSHRIAILHQTLATAYVRQGRLAVAARGRVLPGEAMYLLIPGKSDQRNPDAILFEKWLRAETRQSDPDM